MPQALGKAAAIYFVSPSGEVRPMMSMCSASQPFVAGHDGGDAQGKAFFAQQRIAAIA